MNQPIHSRNNEGNAPPTVTSVFLQQQEQRPTPENQTVNNSIMQKVTSESHK